MLCKTRGIVLHSIPYNDKYSIIYMYTEAFGRASYLVARSRGKKSSVSKALFMPLSVVEMEVEHLNKRDLHRIRETKLCYPLTEVFCNPVEKYTCAFPFRDPFPRGEGDGTGPAPFRVFVRVDTIVRAFG